MALGKRDGERQDDIWIATEKPGLGPGHPFYAKLNGVLGAAGFDRFVEEPCRKFYADGVGRPGIAPGVYFRMLFIGDFEGLDSERGSTRALASGRKRRRFVKLSMVAICVLLLPAALDFDIGPSSDLKQGYRLVRKASKVFTPATMYADSGYDSEEWHRRCWEEWGTMSHAPPVVRSRSGQVGGMYRWMMTNKWPGYGRRWDIETVNCAMKRSLGSTLRARSDTAIKREAAIRVLTHAVKV